MCSLDADLKLNIQMLWSLVNIHSKMFLKEQKVQPSQSNLILPCVSFYTVQQNRMSPFQKFRNSSELQKSFYNVNPPREIFNQL